MMGMFDEISVFMECPFCHQFISFEAQTKDLECEMFSYRPLPNNWFIGAREKKLRAGLPVFRSFPLDKAADVWKNQAERTEAQATIAPEFADQLKYVAVIANCPKCKEQFDGKISIREGKLIGEIYDAVEWKPREPLQEKE